MRLVPLNSIIEIGMSFQQLLRVEKGSSCLDTAWSLHKLKNGLNIFGLRATENAIRQNHDLADLIKDEEDEEHGDEITGSSAYIVRNRLRNAETTLLSEAALVYLTLLSSGRIDSNAFIESPEVIFAEGCWSSLNEVIQNSFREAARCLAYKIPTAAAMQTMRGLEALLRDFCQKCYVDLKQSNGRKITERADWWEIVDALKNADNKPPDDLLAELDQIRNHYRNPTMHPEKEYSYDESVDLWFKSVVITNMLSREIMLRSNNASE